MQLIYDSLTGNVRRFARSLQAEYLARYGTELPLQDVRQGQPAGEYLLLTYTFNLGNIPDTTVQFLREHAPGIRGVVASGSYHWGENFGRAGDLIARQYGVPFVARLNKGGTVADREKVLEWLFEQNQAAKSKQYKEQVA